MINRIESLRKGYESKILEADENIKLLLKNPTDINKEIDNWLEAKEKNYSKLQHLLSYLPQEKKSDGKPI
jgi:hypothetical protein